MGIVDLSKNAWRIDHATRAGLLIDCRAYYRAFHEAARRARRSILVAGWQFDSNVRLLRGEDAGAEPKESLELLSFLDGLCKASPDLRVDLLAWDFSLVFALERELWQKVIFDLRTNERLRFRFDSKCPIGGSHHQKFVVIDDELAFVGGADLCEHRWDDRAHAAEDPLRTLADGTPYTPFHEVQAYVAGPAARRLTELFGQRWLASGGEAIPAHVPSGAPAPHLEGLPTRPSVALPAGPVAFSRTRPPCREPSTSADAGAGDEATRPCREIETLLVDAIGAAERLIYVETQYLTSRSLLRALLARFADAARGKLEVVLILPQRPENMKEQVAVGAAQAKALQQLVDAARRDGHAFGVYNVASRNAAGEDVYEYIHAKLVIVDDRLFTVGSANLTNRSMGLDSELNVTWEAKEESPAVGRAMRRARVSLLAEHVGARGARAVRALVEPEGLVARLDALVQGGGSRLRAHEIGSAAEPAILSMLDPDAFELLDPDGPTIEEELDASVGTLRKLVTGPVTRAWASFTQSAERGE